MNMMFIYDKCFGNDMKTFVDFFREFLIAIREFFCKFFISEFMLDNASRKTIKISFTFTFGFGTFIRRDNDLSYLGF